MQSIKEKPSNSRERKQKLSPLRIFFMKKLKTWFNQPKLREEKTARKKELAKILGKNIQTLKNMYLYGQGSLDDWFRAMDHISHLRQETIIQLYESYPYIENKLNALHPEQVKLHSYISELTLEELALVNNLIEAGLKINDSVARKK
jgi:hypothetical protein